MTTVESNVVDVPQWHLAGDWFDVCNCNIPCPCTFAQPPSSGRLPRSARLAHPRGALW
jgi:hypothetical protein